MGHSSWVLARCGGVCATVARPPAAAYVIRRPQCIAPVGGAHGAPGAEASDALSAGILWHPSRLTPVQTAETYGSMEAVAVKILCCALLFVLASMKTMRFAFARRYTI